MLVNRICWRQLTGWLAAVCGGCVCDSGHIRLPTDAFDNYYQIERDRSSLRLLYINSKSGWSVNLCSSCVVWVLYVCNRACLTALPWQPFEITSKSEVIGVCFTAQHSWCCKLLYNCFLIWHDCDLGPIVKIPSCGNGTWKYDCLANAVFCLLRK